MCCEGHYFLHYGISDQLYRIDAPTNLNDILKTMLGDTLQATEVYALPDKAEFGDTRDWVLEAEDLRYLLNQVASQHHGSERLTPVMGIPNEKVLLYRYAWENCYIWDRGSTYRVDLPKRLEEIVDTLMKQGISSNRNLQLTDINST